MPYLPAPEARHYGKKTARITYHRQGLEFEETIGVVYDPSKLSGSTLDREWDEVQERTLTKLDRTIERVDMTPHQARKLLYEKAWDIALTIRARYPEHVLPHPGLNHPPPDDPRGWWYPSEEERRKIERKEESRRKGRYIAETGDWAVDGEGGD